MPFSFEREIYNVASCTISYWAVHTDDLDDTDDLADFLEEALLAYALNRQKEAEDNPAIIDEDAFEHEICRKNAKPHSVLWGTLDLSPLLQS
ncbi:hypothetical protein E4U58_006812 [Claviceps cyperi]|nr:hypothetical protein E4U58_006812 [Claviceps cyperi]